MPEEGSNNNPRLVHTILDDFRRGDFQKSVKQDYSDLKDFYLHEERKNRLQNMNGFKRFFYSVGWLLKELFLKLTPTRRILLILGLIMVLANRPEKPNSFLELGALVLLFIIMLELKDKLIAKSELEAGRKVQDALKPQMKPDVPGWDAWLYTQSANDVGGDLVDFIKLEENRFGFALGDVAGKGLSAALLMAKLQATLRAVVSDFKSLSELAEKVNRIFHRDGLRNIFASLVYLEVKGNSSEVRFFNAGHFPPVIVKGNETIELSRGSAALGIMVNAHFTEQTLEIEKDNFLVIYSDGITEACNEYGAFYGNNRLNAILKNFSGLSAEQAGNRILTSVVRFVGNAKQHDDLSIIILKKIN
ncbi:MAG: PP2C family protein-serine/threonine phosphatase [Ignavibacteriales bacterium]|nr:PP2C family protein-serine/threonine phosphatase [Ignavibacteriales bacterium]